MLSVDPHSENYYKRHQIWYHGTTWDNALSTQKNGVVSNWNKKAKEDFGLAFYLNSNRDQAVRWARLSASRQFRLGITGKGTLPALVTVRFDEGLLDETISKEFALCNEEWAQEILKNRTMSNMKRTIEVEYGPVADGKITDALKKYQRTMSIEGFKDLISNSKFERRYDQLALISQHICNQIKTVTIKQLTKEENENEFNN
ncbi:hypothetical protein LROSRS0_1527 [Furfurilactobacillus rossiae]|uniref:Uncharacterized protein n=1 Tax=Furfurilactobacillus rossiae DSM 15814 TaxID=1114972 RepID=A0A0R1RQ88_9LACO|nr:hypothetical protein FD35_GL002157 [Furfurilactobacillus rossiae DSM 15814]QFR66143.1 DUF3990 domain-containing protein [Furfurilactobacillus rossiae]QLE61573.1 hypothetical protein LROSRS0_1527 [Furfurilactobacillus rossiae]